MVDNCQIFFRQRAIYTVYTFLFIRTDVIQVLMRFIEIFFQGHFLQVINLSTTVKITKYQLLVLLKTTFKVA